jgi:F-type H+-transporting ATPase subunit epsilon
MKLEIVTPMGQIFSGDIKSATLPGSAGEFGVLPGHSPVISTLNPGVIDVIEENGREAVIAINWGYVDITPESVNILVDEAVVADGNTNEEIASNIQKAKDLIKEFTEGSHVLAYTEGKIERVGS